MLRKFPGIGDSANDAETGGAVRVSDKSLVGALGGPDGAPDLKQKENAAGGQ